jgi:predicted dehydrogenase
MSTTSWGVLGASSFAREHMARAIHEAEGARLAALATSSAERAEGFRAFAPDLRVHASYEDLLADPGVDAVYIPLPNHLHVEWSLKALAAGKHVLVEKPVALRATDIDPLIEARDRSGLFATEAFMIVHHPQWARVRALLDDGAVGELQHVDATFSFNNADDVRNIRNRRETGGGSLPDIGVYTLGSIRWASRTEAADVAARIRWENEIDVWAHVTGTLEGSGRGLTFSAMTSIRLAPRQEVVFHGSTGVLRAVVPFNAGVAGEAQLHLHRDDAVTVERFPTARQYALQVEAFGRHVRDGAPYVWSLEDARATQALIDRVYDVAQPVT